MPTELLKKVQGHLTGERVPLPGDMTKVVYERTPVPGHPSQPPVGWVVYAGVHVGFRYTVEHPSACPPRLILQALARELYRDVVEDLRDLYGDLHELQVGHGDVGKRVADRVLAVLDKLEARHA